MTLHATCTVVFVVVACIITIGLASLKTLHKIAWVGWVGVFCIVCSVFTLMIAVGVQDRPSEAPPTGPWSTGVKVTNTPR
jgi:succinate-acetate transporter protein